MTYISKLYHMALQAPHEKLGDNALIRYMPNKLNKSISQIITIDGEYALNNGTKMIESCISNNRMVKKITCKNYLDNTMYRKVIVFIEKGKTFIIEHFNPQTNEVNFSLFKKGYKGAIQKAEGIFYPKEAAVEAKNNSSRMLIEHFLFHFNKNI